VKCAGEIADIHNAVRDRRRRLADLSGAISPSHRARLKIERD
jgi:hypothetical protein